MGNSKVTVKINGSEYTLMGDETEDYLFSMANYVDKKIKETLQSNPRHSTTSSAVLTAITLTDDLFRVRKQLEEAKDAIDIAEGKLEELARENGKLREEYAQIQTQLETAVTESKEKEESMGKMKGEYDSLYEEYVSQDEELQKQRKENKTLSAQTRDDETRLKDNNKAIEELKGQLLDSQIELVKAKKELKEIKEQQNRRKNG